MEQECLAGSELGLSAEEAQLAGIEQGQQAGEEQPAEQRTEHAHRQQEGRTRGDPPRAVQRDAATGHDHVHVGVMGQCRSPGVQHCGDANPRAEVPAIGGDGQHRVRSRAEQQVIDHRLVLPRDIRDLRRHAEHDVEVADRQQIGLARRQPGARGSALAPGAMPVAAGVVGDPPVPAVVAGLDVTAQRGGAAVLDRRHDLELAEAEMPGLGCAIGRPGAAEDIGDLE